MPSTPSPQSPLLAYTEEHQSVRRLSKRYTVISPAYAGSAPGALPGVTCPKHFAQEAPLQNAQMTSVGSFQIAIPSGWIQG